MRSSSVCAILLALLLVSAASAQERPTAASEPSGTAAQQGSVPPQQAKSQETEDKKAEEKKAEEQLKQQEHQRILGVIPEFNTTSLQDAARLTVRQKFSLAFKSALDPFEFVAAGADAGYSQATGAYVGYGQGAAGYGKRFGAAFADSFDGTILGNALFPALLHEDPRYFRQGTGSIKSRIWYATLSTVRARSDSGGWGPNYGNLLGNLAAGGIANLYYPSSDRGVGLTFERALTVSAEGALGAIGYEFWPDIQRKFLHRHH